MLWLLADVLLLVFGRILLAVALEGHARGLARFTSLTRRGALLLIVLLALLIGATSAATLVPEIIRQVRAVAEELPAVADQARVLFAQYVGIERLSGGDATSGTIGDLARRLASVSSLVLTVVISFVVMIARLVPRGQSRAVPAWGCRRS